MQIKQVIHKEYHDSIYGGLSLHPYVKAKLANPPDFINEMVGIKNTNAYMYRLALRVAAISVQYREAVGKILEEELEHDDVMDIENTLRRMKACPPAGVIIDKNKNNYRCRKYALCPFCRFHKAQEIGDKLKGKLHDARWVAVIKISQPQGLMYSLGDPKEAYTKLIRAICVKRNLFMYDHVVTVPNWHRSYKGDTKEHVFSTDTTIIGLVKKVRGKQVSIKDVGLPLPENCVSRKAREGMAFCGADGWRIMKAEPKSIHRAIGYAMGCSPGLLSDKLYLDEYEESMDMQASYRAVSHGK